MSVRPRARQTQSNCASTSQPIKPLGIPRVVPPMQGVHDEVKNKYNEMVQLTAKPFHAHQAEKIIAEASSQLTKLVDMLASAQQLVPKNKNGGSSSSRHCFCSSIVSLRIAYHSSSTHCFVQVLCDCLLPVILGRQRPAAVRRSPRPMPSEMS
jgi:hypothetical protein